jgi:hypothetical protein
MSVNHKYNFIDLRPHAPTNNVRGVGQKVRHNIKNVIVLAEKY